jgi:adhesin/invasin
VTAWSGSASDSVSVKIGPGVPVTMTLTATPGLIVADGVSASSIGALIVDSFGEPITQVVPITFETTLGQIAPEMTWVVGGKATAILTGTQTGTALVSAQAANTSDSVAVVLVPGPPDQVAVAVAPPQVPAGGQAALQAQVADAYGNAVADGTWVTFTTSLGAADPPVAATAGGVAQSTFLAGTMAGSGVITATAGAAWGTAAVGVLPGPVASMGLAAQPPIVQANGEDQSEIEATLVDGFGNPVVDGTEVSFGSTLGTVDPTTSVTVDGKAYTVLTAGTVAGVATVSGASGLVSATVQVTLLPGPPALLGLVASPRSIPADGQSQATLAVTLTDTFGNPVADGTWITFSTSLGSVWPVTATTQAGAAQSTLTSSTEAGMALVTATAGAASDQTEVTFRPGAAASIDLSIEPPALVANGVSTATVSALVADAFDNPVKDGTRVAFSADLGSVQPLSSTTQGGLAQTVFRAGTQLGTATLAASSGMAWAETSVPLVAGPPAQLALTAADVRLPVKGRFATWVTATVRDAWNHPVADGTAVQFAAPIGSLAPQQALTQDGLAASLYTGTWLGGWIEIEATTEGGVGDSVAVWLDPYRVWLPVVTRGAGP